MHLLSTSSGCRIMAITLAFQAKDTGSIPVTRSKNKILTNFIRGIFQQKL